MPGTGYELESEWSQSLLGFVSPLQTIYLIEEVYAKILIHVLNCLYYSGTTGYGPENRKTQEEKQDKNIAETRDYLLFRAFA